MGNAASPANFPSTAFAGGVRLRKPTRKPEETAGTRVAAHVSLMRDRQDRNEKKTRNENNQEK